LKSNDEASAEDLIKLQQACKNLMDNDEKEEFKKAEEEFIFKLPPETQKVYKRVYKPLIDLSGLDF